jgi:hypothetical protein
VFAQKKDSDLIWICVLKKIGNSGMTTAIKHNVTFQESNFGSRLKCLQVWNDCIQFVHKSTIPSHTFHILAICVCVEVNIQLAYPS